MARPKKPIPTVSVRINEDAQQMARRACGFTGESIVDYISRIVLEQATKDAKHHAEKFLGEPDKPKGKRKESK